MNCLVLMSPVSLVRDWEKLVFVQRWWSSLFSFFYHDMMDLPLVGGTFTWLNNQDTPSWLRIDRFLVSPI